MLEEDRATDDAVIRFVSNSSTVFVKKFFWIQRSAWAGWRVVVSLLMDLEFTKIIRALNWSGQDSWGSNHFHKMIESTNNSSCVYSRFYLVVKEYIEIYHFGCNEFLEFIAIWKYLHDVFRKIVWLKWTIFGVCTAHIYINFLSPLQIFSSYVKLLFLINHYFLVCIFKFHISSRKIWLILIFSLSEIYLVALFIFTQFYVL